MSVGDEGAGFPHEHKKGLRLVQRVSKETPRTRIKDSQLLK